jgi:signal transduction histidine kinase
MRLERFAAQAGRYVLPGLLTLWAASATWGSEDWAAKSLLAAGVAVVLTRRWPLTGLAAAFAGLYVGGALPPPVPEDAQLAMLVLACYLVGRHASLRRQPWAAAGVLLLMSTNVLEPGRDVAPADVVFPVLLTAGPWVLGLSVQLAGRREQAAVQMATRLDETREEDLRRATSEERLRIAQEFHDVVAHDISALSLQAQLARRRAEAGHDVEAAQLREIEHTAQQAMTDLRRLLGFLRPDAPGAALEPAETVEHVQTLVDRARGLGQRVELEVVGTPRGLPPALSMAAYRIVQEAVTNARRHGAGGTTRVEMDWSGSSLGLRIRNPAGTGHVDAAGHGLTGIRERARLFGGHTEIGSDDGHWLVAVELPTPLTVVSAREGSAQ